MSAPNWGFTLTPEECPDFHMLSEEKQAEVIQMATDFLWLWTDQRFGLREVTVRPCREGCSSDQGAYFNGSAIPYPGSGGRLMPVLINGQWTNLGCGRCASGCQCYETPALKLPGPVYSVTEVVVDGETLPETAYRVDDGCLLVRLDGEDWPLCQNMNLPPTEEGTWMITYVRGVEVPAGGIVAARTLACQFAKAITAPQSCDLPQRIQNINRQGVSVTLMDDFSNLKEGGTGIWIIDSWVASVTRATRGGSVLSPDIRPGFRRTNETSGPPPNYYGGAY